MLIFAGSAQLAAVELLVAGAPALVIVATGLVVNLRMLMYSAALAPYFTDVPPGRRLCGSYLLTDQAFAASIARFTAAPYARRWLFYLGTAVPLWLVWQASVLIGAVAGQVIPASIHLEFAVPLAFLAMLIPTLVDRPTLAAALMSAVVSTAAYDLPANLALPLGAVSGVAAGWVLWRRRSSTGPGPGPAGVTP